MKKLSTLKLAMWERGIRQWDMADKTGIPRSYLSHCLNGRMNFKPEEREKIANELGMPVEKLFGDCDAKQDD